MSIFDTILHKIFAAAGTALESAPPKPVLQTPAPEPAPAVTAGGVATIAEAPAPTLQATAAPSAAPAPPVDPMAVLTRMAAQKGGGGNWQTSIVDLLKLLELDSSLASRTQLAAELNVHVAADGSAEQNTALHSAVMQKLAENGGKVPAGLA